MQSSSEVEQDWYEVYWGINYPKSNGETSMLSYCSEKAIHMGPITGKRLLF